MGNCCGSSNTDLGPKAPKDKIPKPSSNKKIEEASKKKKMEEIQKLMGTGIQQKMKEFEGQRLQALEVEKKRLENENVKS